MFQRPQNLQANGCLGHTEVNYSTQKHQRLENEASSLGNNMCFWLADHNNSLTSLKGRYDQLLTCTNKKIKLKKKSVYRFSVFT